MITDALFTQQAIHGFIRQDREIADLQEQLSSGLRDPRVSADPARAMELAALRDLQSDMATQTVIGRTAADRLALADAALTEVADGVRELYLISLQAANDTLTREAHAALRVQAETLRNSLLSNANATDPQGRPLFSGTAPGPAFVLGPEGVSYQGDTAATVVQMGGQAKLTTALPGTRVFGEGQDSIFALLDDLVRGLSEPVLSARDTVQALSYARLELAPSVGGAGAGDTITVTLEGPEGRADIALTLGAGGQAAQVAAINAASADTGIQAQAMADGVGIRLLAAGMMHVSNQTGPEEGLARRPLLTLAQITDTDHIMHAPVALRPAHLASATLIGRASDTVEHMAEMRAAIGAMGKALDSRIERIADTRLTLDKAISRLQDVNVAEAITRLQTLLLNQQAAQQSFVKITGRSLFDYLR
ncbi:MAG: flagellar hook-associated protein 3 [Roseinatronobacter sp.]|nr:flagellar hook-associated protein 3 [Roseinatronobacter sp.]